MALLHEYISVANSQLPRRLQNLGQESPDDRRKRLLKALTLARNLLKDDAPCKFFESGIRKRVKATEYSELNVRKYIVKIYTKLTKHQSNPIGKLIVLNECNSVKRLALQNIFFGTSPSILIQVTMRCEFISINDLYYKHALVVKHPVDLILNAALYRHNLEIMILFLRLANA